MRKDLMSQSEFAEFYGVSQPMIHRYITQGKIPAECIVQEGRYKKIKIDCAVAALEQNLDPGRKKSREESAVKEYDKTIVFDMHDMGLLSQKVTHCLDTLCFVASNLIEPAQSRMHRNIEDVAEIFGFRLVNVEDLTGKRAIAADVEA